jgi:hypothetical protein
VSGLRELDCAEARRDATSDVILCLVILAAGILIGWRLHYLNHDYNAPAGSVECSEDEWISPDTGECVHIDIIVNQNLSDLG